MRRTIPVLRIEPLHAFYWRGDAPQCELYAADLQQLENMRTVDITAAGLPAELTMRSLWTEIAKIKAEDAPRFPRGHGFLLLFDGETGRVIERWIALDPWLMIAARLRAVA